MNPSPDRGKECLPPKKRETRQGSTEHHVILDEFKPPVPLRSRSSAGGGEGSREAGDNDRALLNPNPLIHTPPPLPLPLPWNLSYAPSVSLPLYPGQVSDRRSSGSPAWRDDPLLSPLAHHSRWYRDGPLSLPPSPSSSSTSSFKTPFPAEPRDIWSYFNSGRRDNSSSLFSQTPYAFGQHSLYTQDPSLIEARHRYLNKRPNGLDGQGSRTASTTRTLLTGEYVNENNRTRLDISPRSSHTNGGRRPHEDISSRGGSHSGGSFLSDSQAQESPEAHSSLQERHSIVKSSSNLLSSSPHSLGLVPRPGRGGLLDPLVETPAEAQIYYSLSSVCHPTPQVPAYPLFSPSGSPLYNLHREQGPRQHSLRTSPHSPLGLPNSHDQAHRDREREQDRDRDREKVRQRDRDRTKDKERDKEKDHQHEKDQHDQRRQDSERDRRRETSPSHRYTSPPGLQPPPPALLPHFTKGSLIELASGRLKRVEELRTDDFLRSADTSPEFHLSTCTVLLISPSSAHGFSHLQVHLTDLNTQVSHSLLCIRDKSPCLSNFESVGSRFGYSGYTAFEICHMTSSTVSFLCRSS